MKKCNMCGQTFSNNLIACPNCGGTDYVDIGSQATVNQPMNVQNTNMPMAYAIFIIVILVLSSVSNFIQLLSDFQTTLLFLAIFQGATSIFLIMRSKIGRILALIYSVLEAIGGFLFLIMGLLIQLGVSLKSATAAEELGSFFPEFGSAIGILITAVGAGILAFGICTFIYFKKRKGMYLK